MNHADTQKAERSIDWRTNLDLWIACVFFLFATLYDAIVDFIYPDIVNTWPELARILASGWGVLFFFQVLGIPALIVLTVFGLDRRLQSGRQIMFPAALLIGIILLIVYKVLLRIDAIGNLWPAGY